VKEPGQEAWEKTDQGKVQKINKKSKPGAPERYCVEYKGERRTARLKFCCPVKGDRESLRKKPLKGLEDQTTIGQKRNAVSEGGCRRERKEVEISGVTGSPRMSGVTRWKERSLRDPKGSGYRGIRRKKENRR